MFKFITLHLPWHSADPADCLEPEPHGEPPKGLPSSGKSMADRIRLRLRRSASETMMIVRDEAGALQALCEPAQGVTGNSAWGRGAVVHPGSHESPSAEELAARVVHEIRNPLTAIRIWMFSIQEAVETDPELNRRCNLVCREISRLERLSQNFLDYTRLGRVRLRPVDVSQLLDETIEVLAPHFESLSANVRRSGPACTRSVLADPEQIKQVFTNLLTNAAEALHEGGDIFVSTEHESTARGAMVVVRIRDTGPGMAQKVGARVLEPLASSKHQGKGLGLYIASRITESHGGRLSIESSHPMGTTIAVRIPAAAGEPYGNRPGC